MVLHGWERSVEGISQSIGRPSIPKSNFNNVPSGRKEAEEYSNRQVEI